MKRESVHCSLRPCVLRAGSLLMYLYEHGKARAVFYSLHRWVRGHPSCWCGRWATRLGMSNWSTRRFFFRRCSDAYASSHRFLISSLKGAILHFGVERTSSPRFASPEANHLHGPMLYNCAPMKPKEALGPRDLSRSIVFLSAISGLTTFNRLPHVPLAPELVSRSS